MNDRAALRWISNSIIAAISIAALSAAGTTVHTVYAAEAHPCADYVCDDDSECESVECDFCESVRKRCANDAEA